MNQTMITATNTLSQLQHKMDVISNNVANVNTNGFKKRSAVFTELLAQEFNNQRVSTQEIGRLTPEHIRVGVGSKVGHTQASFTQGSIQATERELDFAFTSSNQYLNVLNQSNTTSEISYTRDGALYVSPVGDGEMLLVDGNGNPLLNAEGEIISFPNDAKAFTLEENGVLIIETPRGNERIMLGITEIHQPQYLEQKGDNLLGLPTTLEVDINTVLTDLLGTERVEISLKQGYLEKSNVDLSKEMTDLINAQRSYQFQTKSISMADQMMGLVNGIR
ncbi:flagellar hook-basal body protein [Bacillus spongiae]|uniref:Flagellar hook-basal body protein n=1 Tax=Bacillus spongiae TaxID=2683610 RepID=A0ABU8HIY0_9BACI